MRNDIGEVCFIDGFRSSSHTWGLRLTTQVPVITQTIALFAGVIPASFSDQLAAQRLAMCNDIGEASYIDSFIAAAMLEVFSKLPSFPAIDERLKTRFKISFGPSMTGRPSCLAS